MKHSIYQMFRGAASVQLFPLMSFKDAVDTLVAETQQVADERGLSFEEALDYCVTWRRRGQALFSIVIMAALALVCYGAYLNWPTAVLVPLAFIPLGTVVGTHFGWRKLRESI